LWIGSLFIDLFALCVQGTEGLGDVFQHVEGVVPEGRCGLVGAGQRQQLGASGLRSRSTATRKQPRCRSTILLPVSPPMRAHPHAVLVSRGALFCLTQLGSGAQSKVEVSWAAMALPLDAKTTPSGNITIHGVIPASLQVCRVAPSLTYGLRLACDLN
jgi:hypothetical protein